MRKASNKITRRVYFRITFLLALVLVPVLVYALLPKPISISGGGGSYPAGSPSKKPDTSARSTTLPSPAKHSAPSPAPAENGFVRDPNKALIIFTFDDGYVSDYNLAYPILKKYGIRGTSYIIGKFPDSNTPNTLSWDQIKEMKAYGWDFGCHTYYHTDMTKLTPDQIKDSLEKENQAFVRQGLEPPQIIAYPSGKFNQKVIDVVRQYRKQGRLAFYESKFVDLQNADPYQIDSISADMQEMPRLQSREKLVDKACAENAVIVFRTHCMYFSKKNDDGHWDVQTDSRLFEQLVQYCVDKNCQFATMTQLMQLCSEK